MCLSQVWSRSFIQFIYIAPNNNRCQIKALYIVRFKSLQNITVYRIIHTIKK